jgi:penicillin-binding protein 1A
MPKKRYQKEVFKNKEKNWGIFLKLTVFCLFLFFLSFFSLFIYYAKDLPRPEIFSERELAQSTKIYDRSGKVLLYELYGEEKRTWVPLEIVPNYLKEAIIATEDANFYHHFGVDLKGIARAILEDFKIGQPVYGGSTIPQQLIRSTFLSLEKTAKRKTREIILTLELDRRYPKDQILEWYLNQVPFGQNAYGVEEASQTYFKKSVSEISLTEAATLAALIRAPYRLSPYGENKDELISRKDYVLDRMVKERYLTLEEAEKAKNQELKFIERPMEIQAPYFTLWVKQQLTEKYGEEFLRRSGWRIYTSLDWEMQKTAEEVVKEGIERNKTYNARNAALVAIDPKTGEVLAMTVGTGNYFAAPYPEGCKPGVNCLFDPQFNVAVGTKENPGRQPGSAFKPFIYATAFKKGYDDKTQVLDELTNFGLWGEKEYVPRNYDGLFRGWVSLRQGLAQSLNIPSIKVLYFAGLETQIENLGINNFKGLEGILTQGLKESLQTAKDLGITTLNKPLSSYGPAIVLGGGEVNLLEMTSAYGVFANDGQRASLKAILKIEDSKGNIIEENKKTLMRVLETEITELINDILSDNDARAPMFGPRSHLYFENYQVAAKTGTTDDFRDCWTVGYTPKISVGVWVGNNNNAPMLKRQPAATVAGPIFHDFLGKVLPRYPQENFLKPE